MISASASFTGVVNAPTQIPKLNVAKLSADIQSLNLTTYDNMSVTNITIKDGHLYTRQDAALKPSVKTNDLTTASIATNFTDVAGTIQISGTTTLTTTITVYHTVTTPPTVYPQRFVLLTGANLEGGKALAGGTYVTSTDTGFIIHVNSIHFNPEFNYITVRT